MGNVPVTPFKAPVLRWPEEQDQGGTGRKQPMPGPSSLRSEAGLLHNLLKCYHQKEASNVLFHYMRAPRSVLSRMMDCYGPVLLVRVLLMSMAVRIGVADQTVGTGLSCGRSRQRGFLVVAA